MGKVYLIDGSKMLETNFQNEFISNRIHLYTYPNTYCYWIAQTSQYISDPKLEDNTCS